MFYTDPRFWLLYLCIGMDEDIVHEGSKGEKSLEDRKGNRIPVTTELGQLGGRRGRRPA